MEAGTEEEAVGGDITKDNEVKSKRSGRLVY